MQKMRGIEEKKGREKDREKKRRKGGKNLESSRKKKEKKVHAQVFPLRSRHFWDQSEIRYFGKSNLYLLSFSWKIF